MTLINHQCKRCDGTGRYHEYGTCYSCNGTGDDFTEVYRCAYDAYLSYCEEVGEPGMMDDETEMQFFCEEYVSRWKTQATDQ